MLTTMNVFLFFFISSFLFQSCSANFNQLSFSGGGSFGAVEIGILKRIAKMDGNKQYDLYTGISAGALNSGFLSYYRDVAKGVIAAEKLYSTIHNFLIFEVAPFTGVSVLNTEPLYKTLSLVIDKMPNKPVVHTLIGATNLFSGTLDVFTFEDNDDSNKVLLMMSSSAIPGIFPPVTYKGNLYADGGTLSNELLQVQHNGGEYINITYITPSESYMYNDEPIDSLENMLKRVFTIVSKNFNNPLASINQNCINPIGEINKFYVEGKYLTGYSSMNFNYGKELVDIGYNYMTQKKYKLC
jgi:NTE family protein